MNQTANATWSADAPFIAARLPQAKAGLPGLWTPRGAPSLPTLIDWVSSHREDVNEALLRDGAVLVRGYPVHDAAAVEALAAAFTPSLQQDYMGTSPRNAVTPRVFNASELPGFYPIPQHCEMTFVRKPPEQIFFSCLVAPASGMGETPITDFAAVARDLDPRVRERFETRRLRIIRNYSGPSQAGRKDLWQLKRWDEMFGTTDRAAVEAKAASEGFTVEWVGVDGLRILSEQDAFQTHPITGATVWFNHTQVFHLAAGPAELRRAFRLRPGVRSAFFWGLAGVLAARKRLQPSLSQAMHVTWADGTAIDNDDVEHVLDVIWQNQVVFPWQKGDFLALDNRRVAHGRLPYRGPRKVVVAWA